MADFKISQIAQANVVNKDDLIYLIQNNESKNVKASTLFDSIADPTLAGNIIFGGMPQVMNSSGTISITTTRTDLYGGVAANANAIANGTILPSSIYLYTEGVSATGRGLRFVDGTPTTTTLFVKYSNNKINLAAADLVSSYSPDDWVGSTGLRPFPSGLNFVKGAKYIFDVSHPTNSGNVLALSTSIDGTNTQGTRYTANIVTNGTPGNAGANIVFNVPITSIDPGGKTYLDFPTGVDGQLKVVNLVKTGGGSFVISSNLQNNISVELKKSGDSAFMMYSGNGWIFIGASPGLVTTFSGTSDDVPEGQKLYFTNARARAAISAGDSSIIYDKANGTIRANATALAALVGTVAFTGNTNAVAEGSLNLYYTNARVYANVFPLLASKANVTDLTTANVIESTSNLYYTNARVYANVSPLLVSKANVTDLTTANVLESTSNLYYTNARVYANVFPLLASKANVSDLTTANVIESASNLYYTNARVYANVFPLLELKANVTDLTTANVLESTSNLYYTNARVYANVFPLLASKANVTDLTTANVLESASNLYYTNARVYANVLALLPTLAGNNIVIEANGRISSAISLVTGNLTVTGNIIANGLIISGIDVTNSVIAGNVIATSSISNIITANSITTNSIASNIWTGIYTANVIESDSNLYYTNARVYANVLALLPTLAGNSIIIEANGRISANSDAILGSISRIAGNLTVTGNIIANGLIISGIDVTNSVIAGNVIATSSISNIITANSITTNSVASNIWQGIYTANVIESASNLYYTNDRVQTYLQNIAGSLLPAVGNLYDIGSNDKPFRDLWLYGSSIKFSNSGSFSSTANTFAMIDSGGSVVFTANANNIPITSSTGKLTSNLIESVPNFSTSNINEGTNLYYTNARVYANVTPLLASKANVSDLSTANVLESASNLYYTNARVYSALSGGTGVNYSNTSGLISIDQNVATTASVTFGNLTITGQVNFYGNVTTHSSNNLSISDNMIYLNSGSESSNPDLGFAGNYNDGVYRHAGFFRDARQGGTWKVFDGYSPEPDANIFIDTNHATFSLANLAAKAFFGNLYGTVSSLSNFTTSNLAEGTNLYYTNARVYANVFPLLASKANVTDLTTANVLESTSNLYFTNARAILNVIPAVTELLVTAPGMYYNIDQYSGTNPAIAVTAGETISFGLNTPGHPFLIRILAGGSNYDTGLTHVDNDGTTSIGSSAQGKISGKLFWKVPYSLAGNTYVYQCSIHGGMVGNIVISKSISSTTDLPEGTNLYYTNARVYANVSPLLVTKANVTDLTTANVIESASNLYYTNARVYANVAPLLAAKANVTDLTTANVIESGSNQYFTNVRAQLALQPTIAELRSLITAPTSNVIYVAGNGNDNNTGNTEANALANIHVALARAHEWTTVFVKSGDYTLYNQPVNIGKRVGLVGDNLRTTTIRPSQPSADMFYVNNACYVTGFTFRDHVSPSAVFSYNPDGSAGVIVTSPYIQNSSSITTTGTGMRVDGRYVRGLRSMVCDSYTQTNEGGIGIHMLNRGYTQLVSVFTICCHIAIKCESGGFCSITNSNASFGTYALYADGVSEPLYFGKLTQDTVGQEFTITNLEQRPNYGDSVLFADFSETKCSRDTGLIVDALAFDLAYQGNSQSNFAALQYWSQTSSAIPNQSPETLAAIAYAKNLATNVVANIRIVSPYQVSNVQQFATSPTLIADATSNIKIAAGFDLISNIIIGGTTGVTDRIIPNNLLANTNAFVNHASNLLYLNNTFIASEVVAFVNATYPGFFANASNFIDFANASSRCAKDVGYILDSIRFDVLHDGNRQAIQAGTYYYNYSTDTTQINNQVVQTGASYNFIGSIMANIITATAVSPTYPQYNVTKCIRDSRLIVDSLGIDLAYDSNTQATFAGLQYWAQTSSSIPNQSPETLAAINYAKNLSTNVLANTTVTGLYQANVSQIFNTLKGTAVEANLIATGFDLISNIISYGTVGVTDRIIPNGYPANTAATVQQAANLLILNKTFIATEVFAFVNTTYPGFFANANNFVDFTNAATKCQRDVGYMIESVTFDLLHGGNRQAIQAGTYYYNYSSNTTQINNQIVQTGAAYRFISSLLPNILTNTAVTYKYQNSISQNTTAASAATLNEVYTINRDISLISNIIVNGPSAAPTKVSITNTANTNINTINATKILFANKDFIVAELIAYTNQIIFDLPAGNLVTQNTTAAPASTFATANLILQNINLITNVITYGPSVAAPKTPIGLTISTDANLVNAATLMIANKDFIKAEVLDYVKTNWATISNGSGTFYTVKNATPLANGTSTITLLETVFETIHANSSVSFHQGSYISSSGHTFEYVGAGDTIATALPYLGGIPIQENEITELRGGKVFFTSTDQRGDFRIGTGLVINRVDGTISGRTFNKALFAVMTPYMLAIEG